MKIHEEIPLVEMRKFNIFILTFTKVLIQYRWIILIELFMSTSKY